MTEISSLKDPYNVLTQYVRLILDAKLLKSVHCVVYGSRVYGTARLDSDWDIYCIVESELSIEIDMHNNDTKIDLTIRSIDMFEKDIRTGQPLSVEVLLTPREFVLIQDEKFNELTKTINLRSPEMRKAIRHGFSERASWAEVRARKKLIDGDVLCALKSLYHSYRIFGFGIQIGLHNTINDWSWGKEYLDELLSLDPKILNDQSLRASYKKWTKTGCIECKQDSIQTQFKNVLPK